MNFKPCIDFFRKGKKIFLTQICSYQVNKIKLTGTKIPQFFKLKILNLESPYGEEDPHEIDLRSEKVPSSPYQIWTKVFHFPFISRRNMKKMERYRQVEEIIKEYLEKNLNKEWINYPIEKTDIFDDNENLGGVPDGEEYSETGEVVSMLEIKTITELNPTPNEELFISVPLVYQLQLALYMYLRNIDTGYICICYMNPNNWGNTSTIQLNSRLSKYSSKPQTFNILLESWIPEIGTCPYSYELQEAYCNEFLEDNPLILLKIKIDLVKYSELISKLEDWFCNHKESSPNMSEEEFFNFSAKNPMW